MIKIIVCGAAGKVGQSILRLAGKDKEFQVAGALEMEGHPMIGKGEPAITDTLSRIIGKADMLIDFTSPAATLAHLTEAEKAGKAVIIGTTGFKEDERTRIKSAAKKIPVIFSPNMSMGVNVLFRLVEQAAKTLPGYDVEIVELHHNQKKDSPSGTAAMLLQVAAHALGKDVEDAVYGREGMVGPRTKNEIGVMAVRAGDIVGEHTVYFAGPGERIELTHRAHSRDNFAAGALLAAKWLAGRKPGLYDMQDVLGLRK